MRALFENAKNQYVEFVEQRDELFLFLSCSDNDAPVSLKLLQDVEQANGTDVFLLFADDFVRPAPYVSVLVERLRQEHGLAQEFAKENGKPALAPFPAELSDESMVPPERLWRALKFARNLLPKEGGHRLVVGLFPQGIQSPREFVELLWKFLPWRGVERWMSGLRLVVRDPAIRQLAPQSATVSRVRFRAFDFGPEAVQRGLEEDTSNEELPEADRMQALLLSASMDFAFHRQQEAVPKYQALLGYYQKTGDLPMQAFILNSFGDFYSRAGDVAKAQHWYECALVPAADSQDVRMLSVVGKNLGEMAYRSGRFPEAEAYFDGCDKLAAQAMDVESKIRALEWKGLSQERQGALQQAAATWNDGALLARNIGLPGFLRQLLGHMGRVYQVLGVPQHLAAVQLELQTLQGVDG